MRFMMLMIPKGYEKAAPGTLPQEMSDFPADVQEAAAKFPELQTQPRK